MSHRLKISFLTCVGVHFFDACVHAGRKMSSSQNQTRYTFARCVDVLTFNCLENVPLSLRKYERLTACWLGHRLCTRCDESVLYSSGVGAPGLGLRMASKSPVYQKRLNLWTPRARTRESFELTFLFERFAWSHCHVGVYLMMKRLHALRSHSKVAHHTGE